MASSITSSTLIIFLIPSILVLFSPPVVNATTSSSTLINKVCSLEGNYIDYKFCTRLLESHPKIVSAANMVDLSTRIIKSGISSATNMCTYIEKLLKASSTDSKLQEGLKKCNSSYNYVLQSLKSAQISEVDEKDFEAASYDLLLAGTDAISECMSVVASKAVTDKTISRGNQVLQVFALSADQAVMTLDQPQPQRGCAGSRAGVAAFWRHAMCAVLLHFLFF